MASLHTQLLLLPLLLVLLAALSDALRVQDGGISQLAGAELSDRARVVRTWSVMGAYGERLLAIHSGVKCQVYVTYNAYLNFDDAAAVVRVLGDSEQMVQSLVAVSASGDGQLDLTSPPHQAGETLDGYVRVEIVTNTMSVLRQVVVSSSGAVIVSENLLSNDWAPQLMLKTTESGDLFVKSQHSVNVNRIQIQSSGSGSIYFSAGSVVSTSLEVSTNGSGDVKMDATSLQSYSSLSIQTSNSGSCFFKAGSVTSATANFKTNGSGDVKLDVAHLRTYSSLTLTTTSSGRGYLKAQEVSSSLANIRCHGSAGIKIQSDFFQSQSSLSVEVTSAGEVLVSSTDMQTSQLTVTKSSSGEVSIEGGSKSIAQCDIAVSGSGDANLGNVICRNAHISSSGSAEITVQVTEGLNYGTSSQSKIYYVGQAPRSITSTSQNSDPPKSHATGERMTLSMPTWSTSYNVPPPKLYHVSIGDAYSLIWDLDDDDGNDGKPPNSNDSPMEEPSSDQKNTNWQVVLFGGLIVLFIVLWGRVEKAWRKRRQRLSESFPLLGREAPVYI